MGLWIWITFFWYALYMNHTTQLCGSYSTHNCVVHIVHNFTQRICSVLSDHYYPAIVFVCVETIIIDMYSYDY